jgi:hypothetical protein
MEFTISQDQFEKLIKRFNERVDGFSDFSNPGENFTNQELEYKRKALERFGNELGKSGLQRLVDDGLGQEALGQLGRCVQTNLVQYNSWWNSFGATDEQAAAIIKAFLNVAKAKYGGPKTLEPLFTEIENQKLKPAWDTMSTVLWALRPTDYFPIKISYYRELAEELGQPLPKGRPTADGFDAVRKFGEAFYEVLQPLKPSDWIDVQSFIWCVCPRSYDKLEGSKKDLEKKSGKTSEPGREKSNGPTDSINMILYGPPGTGKTYQTVNYALSIIENKSLEEINDEEQNSGRDELFRRFIHYRNEKQIEFITFHQNYAYEDFIQGLRPILSSSGKSLEFELRDGIFKKIADRARNNFEASRRGAHTENQKPPFEKVFRSFFKKLYEGEQEAVKIHMKRVSYQITEISEKSIFFIKHSGGTGHTLSINTLSEYYDLGKVTMEAGLKIYYEPLLQELLKHSKVLPIESTKEDLKNFVIVIDEINRANISRVFGELITLIEDDKRFGQINEMRATLPSGEPFFVPPNLYIIGTMNTADKSIALLDIALRRRFEFIKIYPNSDLVISDYRGLFDKMNQQIIEQKGPDFQIGHAYFMKNDHKKLDLKGVMNKKVIPLLYEYFMNDGDAVNRILKAADINTIQNSGLYEFESL